MNFRYGLLQGFYWAAFCVVFSFYIPLFESFGYDTFTCGVIAMCSTAALALAQPLWGVLCDRSKKIKPILAAALLCGIAGSVLLRYSGKSVFNTVIAVVVLSSTTQSLMYIFDTWSIRLKIDGAKISFGLTRSFGSAFYATTAALFGAALDRFGMGIMTPVFIVLSLIVIALILTIREPSARNAHPRQEDNDSFATGVKKLLKNRAYLSLLLAVFFVFFGSSGSMLFLSVRISDLGGGNGDYGLALFIMAMSEVPALLSYKKLAPRFSNYSLLCISMFFMVLKISAVALSPRVWMIVALMTLQAPSYGIYLSSIANYVPEIVERRTVFTAQTVIAAIVSGLAGICSNLFMGAAATAIGLRPALCLMIAFPAVGLLIFCLSKFLVKKPSAPVPARTE